MVRIQTKDASCGFVLVAASLISAFPSIALAAGEGLGYHHGMFGGGWGWAAMIVGPIMMIAVLATVVVVVVLIIRWLGGGHSVAHMGPQNSGNSALNILRERFAKGEIDKDEFEQKRDLLGD